MSLQDPHQRHGTRQEAFRTELEATQVAFHTLLAEIKDVDWNRRCVGSDWTIAETLSHITASMTFYPTQVDRARKGRGIPRLLPPFIVNQLNTVMTRRGAREASRQALREQYDTRLAALLATLNGVQENEWDQGARFFGTYQTVSDILHAPARHFNEHADQIRQTLAAQ